MTWDGLLGRVRRGAEDKKTMEGVRRSGTRQRIASSWPGPGVEVSGRGRRARKRGAILRARRLNGRSGAVAFLEFLRAATGAGVVAADVLQGVAHRFLAVAAVGAMHMALMLIVPVVMVAVGTVDVGFLAHGGTTPEYDRRELSRHFAPHARCVRTSGRFSLHSSGYSESARRVSPAP